MSGFCFLQQNLILCKEDDRSFILKIFLKKKEAFMDKNKIFLIDAVINFSNLNLLTSDMSGKFVATHCDKCDKRSESFIGKHYADSCRIVSKEVLFLESLTEILPFLEEDASKSELASVGKDLINVVWLFLFEHSFKSEPCCDTERHSVLSKLAKISSRISEAVA